MARVLRGDVKRALQHHQSNLREVVQGFKKVVEKDESRPPKSVQLDARKEMLWQFGPFRKRMREEMVGIAKSLDEGTIPEDFDLKITRLSLAMYLLDKMEEMLGVVIGKNNTSLTCLFTTAQEFMMKLLDDRYFSKSSSKIKSDYQDASYAFVSCAESAEVCLLSIRAALEKYKSVVAKEIQAIDA